MDKTVARRAVYVDVIYFFTVFPLNLSEYSCQGGNNIHRNVISCFYLYIDSNMKHKFPTRPELPLIDLTNVQLTHLLHNPQLTRNTSLRLLLRASVFHFTLY